MCIGRRPHKGSFKGICKDMPATSEVRNAKVSDSSAAPVCHAWQASRIEFDRVSIQGGTASATPISAATGALCADGVVLILRTCHMLFCRKRHIELQNSGGCLGGGVSARPAEKVAASPLHQLVAVAPGGTNHTLAGSGAFHCHR